MDQESRVPGSEEMIATHWRWRSGSPFDDVAGDQAAERFNVHLVALELELLDICTSKCSCIFPLLAIWENDGPIFNGLILGNLGGSGDLAELNLALAP